jgi:hypothetical protein
VNGSEPKARVLVRFLEKNDANKRIEEAKIEQDLRG